MTAFIFFHAGGTGNAASWALAIVTRIRCPFLKTQEVGKKSNAISTTWPAGIGSMSRWKLR